MVSKSYGVSQANKPPFVVVVVEEVVVVVVVVFNEFIACGVLIWW